MESCRLYQANIMACSNDQHIDLLKHMTETFHSFDFKCEQNVIVAMANVNNIIDIAGKSNSDWSWMQLDSSLSYRDIRNVIRFFSTDTDLLLLIKLAL